MKKSGFVTLGVAALMTVAAVRYSVADQTSVGPVAKKHKVVFQVAVDGDERYNEVLNNIENTVRAFGKDNVDIAVITHGKGVGLVTKGVNPDIAKRVEALESQGVTIGICAYTCERKKIADEDIAKGVNKVEGGVAEIVRLQEQGYVYIKPGS